MEYCFFRLVIVNKVKYLIDYWNDFIIRVWYYRVLIFVEWFVWKVEKLFRLKFRLDFKNKFRV